MASRKLKTSRKVKKGSRKTSRKVKKGSRKVRRPRSYLNVSKKAQRSYVKSCGSRKKKSVCVSEPNCSWNKSRRKCYRGKRAIYAGPALE